MLQRMAGAATLKSTTFEEIEKDKSATTQAMLVVVLVALATGAVGAGAAGIWGLVLGVVGALIGWALWAWIIYFIGTTFFKTAETQASWGELARTLGFAQTPGLLGVLGIIGAISEIILFVAFLWQLAAMVVAVRQALDFNSTLRAVGVVIVGAIPVFVLRLVLTALGIE